MGPRGGVVTQRSAKPCTPVQFWSWPPSNLLKFQSISFAFCSANSACYRIATFRFGPVSEGRFQGRIHGRNGILLHPRNDVAVQVQRDPDLAVTQPLAGDLGVDAVGEQVGSVGVPKIMEPEPGQRRLGDRPGPLLRNINRRMIEPSAWHHEVVVRQAHAELEHSWARLTRWARNSSTTVSDSATVRPLPLLGDLKRRPALVCSRLSTTEI